MTQTGYGAVIAPTYSGRLQGGIDLALNPATIAAGAYVTDAGGPDGVFGKSGIAWTVANFGTVLAQDAVFLESGGSVSNAAGAELLGSGLGVVIDGGAGAVSNSGSIAGGVDLDAGGSVNNQFGMIGAYGDGVYANGTASVVNTGSIVGAGTAGTGILLLGGGYASNAVAALVSGVLEGIEVENAAGTVVNLGTVTASAAASIGVNLAGGGSLVNADGAAITAGNFGVLAGGGAATVTNSGVIDAGGLQGVGVDLSGGGYLNNTSTGLIEAGLEGIYISGGNATVVNYGTIIAGYGVRLNPGTAGYAVATIGGTIIGTTTVVSAGRTFQEAIEFVYGTDRLILTPSAVIDGNINGPGDTLELAAETNGIGTLSGFQTTVLGFITVVVDAGAVWQLYGDAGETLFTNDGTILVPAGEALSMGSVAASAGATGVVDIGGTASFDNSVAKGQSLVFTAGGAELVLDDPSHFDAKITAFKRGDTIDIADEAGLTGTYADGKLTLVNAKGKTVATLRLAGRYTSSEFTFTSDGTVGTLITLGKNAAAFGAADLPMLSAGPQEAAAWWTMRG
jgi:hypothetical protein